MKWLSKTAALLVLCACDDDLGAGGSGAGGESAQGGSGAGVVNGAGGEGGEVPPEPVPGLRAEYFTGYLDLALERVEPTLDAQWGLEGPSAEVGIDRFSARWTGTLTAPETGTYTIITDNDDGVRVWIGGALVIDDWRGHFVTRNTAEVALEAGVPVDLRVDYFELDIEASMKLSWSSATLPEQVIPTSALWSAPERSALASPKPPYTNPVVPFDCPDPGVVATGDAALGFIAVCTGGTFPIRSSRSLVFWAATGAALLPEGKPSWAANGFRNWAPEVHRVGDHWVAYYTTVNGANVLSVAAATATSPLGPYTHAAGPLVEHPQGVIDATFFEDDDGSRWLVYKIDGNSVGQPTPMFIRRLAEDGMSFAPGSTATEVLRNNTNTWEGGVVEAPWIVKRDGTYYMFYSGNVYDFRYRTGVARASVLTGPYEKKGAPILANNERWVGPGHGSVVSVADEDYFVYHAWPNAGNGQHNGDAGRHILVDKIVWQDGWPTIHDGTPSRTPQIWPGAQ